MDQLPEIHALQELVEVRSQHHVQAVLVAGRYRFHYFKTGLIQTREDPLYPMKLTVQNHSVFTYRGVKSAWHPIS